MDSKPVEDAFHLLDSQFLSLSEEALETEPTARLHLIRCAAGRALGVQLDPMTELSAAMQLNPTPSDGSLAAALEMLLSSGPAAAANRFVEHCEAYEGDALASTLRYSALVMSGVPGNCERAHALTELDGRKHAGDWRFDTMVAMTRQEQRRYDEARDLAERSLAEQPDAGFAVHVLTHVNYETGEHAEGLDWLDEWQQGRVVLGYQSHLRWHSALHALALGDVEQALSRYSEGVGPNAIIDAGSLLWRCRLAGATLDEVAHEAKTSAAPTLDSLPTPFLVFNACLALAAAGDASGLESVAARLATDPRPAFADLVAPIATALCAVVDGRFERAIAILEATSNDSPRVGGSNAQREVIEDTLIYALLSEGKFYEANERIRIRLGRRSHALDLNQLETGRPFR
jgi:tetratricopeptide (TPR) repeat protein